MENNTNPILSFDGEEVPAELWFQEPSLPSTTPTAAFECVVIGKYKDEYSSDSETENLLPVLLVAWKDGVAYREGLVHIDVSVWVKLGPEWKLICLG